MKRNSFIGLLLAGLLFTLNSSCRKEKQLDKPDIIPPDHIVIGDSTGMKVRELNLPSPGRSSNDSILIDIDGNGITDFQINISSFLHNTGLTYNTNLVVKDSSTWISYIPAVDSEFLYHDTSIIQDSGSPTIYVYYTTSYSCNGTGLEHLYRVYHVYHFKYYEPGSTLDLTGSWRHSWTTLSHNLDVGLPDHVRDNGDTSIWAFTVFGSGCQLFPDNVPVYLGVKKIIHGKSYLGWIKLLVHEDYAVVYETALQKIE